MKKALPPLITLLILLSFWEFAVYYNQKELLIIPSPSASFLRIVKSFDRFSLHSQITLFEMLAGFLVALTISFPFGLIMSLFGRARAVLQPLFVFIQCIPMFALAPIMVIFFGWSYTAIIIPTALMIFFPLTINIYQGFCSTPKELLDYFRINQATDWQIFYKLKLPFALPQIFAGLKIAAGAAGIGAVAGEFAGAKAGLGILMLESRRATDLETTFAALFCLSILSMSFYLLILTVEKMMMKKWSFNKKTFTLLVFFIGFFLTGCTKDESVKIKEEKSTRLLLDWLPNPNHIPLYVGVKKDFFKEEGINLEIQKIPDPSDAIPYLVAGKADLALYYMPDTVRANEAGYGLKPIAILFKQPLNALIFRKGEGILNPVDLNDKVIGYSVDGSSTKVLDFILKKNEIFPKEKQNVTFDLVTTLCLKQVDAIYGAYWNIECEHMRTLNQETAHFDLVSLGYPNYYELVVVANSDSLESKELFQEAFKKALQKSIDYAVSFQEEAFSIYLSENRDKSEKTIAWEGEAWGKTAQLLAKDQVFDEEVMENLRNWIVSEKLY